LIELQFDWQIQSGIGRDGVFRVGHRGLSHDTTVLATFE
jgi:hypothetical protein